MKIILKVLGVIVGIIFFLVGLIMANQIYPFRADNPNFSHVEAAFSKLEFPSDWQKIGDSENRGRSGRACDAFNNSGCFHKSAKFKVRDAIEARNQVRELFLKQPGCTKVIAKERQDGNGSDAPMTAATIRCITPGGITYVADSSVVHDYMDVSVNTYGHELYH